MTQPDGDTTLFPDLTTASLALFADFCEDAQNWGGKPLVNGNVSVDKARQGNLTDLKMKGLLNTYEDADKDSYGNPLFWVVFTDFGRAFAESQGITITQ